MNHHNFFKSCGSFTRFGESIVTTAFFVITSLTAHAQDSTKDGAQLKTVQVTGSAISRNEDEKALPVVLITAQEIRSTGVTSVVDLVRKLTFTQGATGESSSVGGETFGFAGISIHNVGENRTLVLLNGRRLAQFGGQDLTGFAAAFDLNSIPISAVERIELLTDGASALYGADAIGGVVNVITKQGITDGDVTIGFARPKGGAQEKKLSATKGFGSLVKDDFNVLLSFGHDDRTALSAGDRRFSRTGQVGFSYRGQQYQFQQLSTNNIPANAIDDLEQLVSPYRLVNGVCPANSFRVVSPPYVNSTGLNVMDDYCGLDFVRGLEIYPERKRDNFMGSVVAKFGAHELFANLLLSRTSQVSRIAAVPGELEILAGSPLHNQYLLPVGITADTLAFYRLADLGQRTSSDTAEFANVVVGSRGKLLDWHYELGYSHSESNVKSRISGYPGALALGNLAATGLLDPFVGPGQQSVAAQTALAGVAYNGYWNGGVSKLDALTLNGTYDLGPRFGRDTTFAAGLNLNREYFASKPSLFAQGRLSDPVAGILCDGTPANPCDQRFGDAAASLPYSASRTSTGLYGELLMPVAQTLDLGASLRLDHYSDFGNATTGKASFKWAPTTSVFVRGSIGTGFHAPTVPQVKAALQGFGVTSEKYDCTPELLAAAAALGAVCRPNNSQYDVLAAGNRSLQPEKSKQASLGFRIEPTKSPITFGADFWHVQIASRFGQLTEQVVFANPGAFPNSFGSQVDVGTGNNYLAFLANNQNLGKSYATGIDLDLSGKMSTPMGALSSQFTLTQVLREVSQLEKNGKYYSAVGNLAELGTVTFRTQGRAAFSLKSSEAWTNTLGINFKSGYRDQLTTVDVIDAIGNVTGTEDIRIHVKSYATVDWQTEWNAPGKAWSINAGVLNLFNRSPPFSVSSSGLDRGSQYGYDDRYYDPRGRTVYVNASYKF